MVVKKVVVIQNKKRIDEMERFFLNFEEVFKCVTNVNTKIKENCHSDSLTDA